MDIPVAIALFLSGGAVAASVILPSLAFSRNALSRRSAASLAGVGVGVGVGVFIFVGVGGGDYAGSLVVAMIAGATAGLAMHLALGSHLR